MAARRAAASSTSPSTILVRPVSGLASRPDLRRYRVRSASVFSSSTLVVLRANCSLAPRISTRAMSLPSYTRLQVGRIAVALHRDVGQGGFDLAQIVRTQLDGCPANILLETVQLGGAGDRHDPGLLSEQPGERYLCRRRVLARRDLAQHVDQALVGLAVLFREARHDVAEVGLIEADGLGDRACQESLAERAEGHEADAKFRQKRQDLLFRLAPPQRIFALQRRHGLHGMGAPDRVDAGFRKTEMLDL